MGSYGEAFSYVHMAAVPESAPFSFQGAGLLITTNGPISPDFKQLGQAPLPSGAGVVLGIALFMLARVQARRQRVTQTQHNVFGRRIYVVGSNMEATYLAGINVRAVKPWIFGLMGLICALAGLCNPPRLAADSPSAGTSG